MVLERPIQRASGPSGIDWNETMTAKCKVSTVQRAGCSTACDDAVLTVVVAVVAVTLKAVQ